MPQSFGVRGEGLWIKKGGGGGVLSLSPKVIQYPYSA